jgi:hypothetical protein
MCPRWRFFVHAPLPAATAASRLNPVYALAEGRGDERGDERGETRETHRTRLPRLSPRVQLLRLLAGRGGKTREILSATFSRNLRVDDHDGDRPGGR